MTQIAISVNGESRSAEVEPRQLLVYYLREQLGIRQLTAVPVQARRVAEPAHPLEDLVDRAGRRRSVSRT